MSEQDQHGTGSLAEDLTGLPEPIQKSFFKAVGSLLEGLIALPVAKLNQLTQAINDTTAARTRTSAAIATAVAEDIVKDPDLVAVAAEVYLPTTMRKVGNRIKVAQRAAEHLSETADEGDADRTSAPDENWMNNFMRFAEDASSEELQDMLGRLLAGQILRPGAFSLATLRTLNELDQGLARDFLQAWSRNVGEEIDYSQEWQRGEGYRRWQRLIEAGLLAPDVAYAYLPDFKPDSDGNCLWTPMDAGSVWVNIAFRETCTIAWGHIAFTRAGREIGSLLPCPDYANNQKQAALRLSKDGVSWIKLYERGTEKEVLWMNKR